MRGPLPGADALSCMHGSRVRAFRGDGFLKGLGVSGCVAQRRGDDHRQGETKREGDISYHSAQRARARARSWAFMVHELAVRLNARAKDVHLDRTWKFAETANFRAASFANFLARRHRERPARRSSFRAARPSRPCCILFYVVWDHYPACVCVSSVEQPIPLLHAVVSMGYTIMET